MPINGPKGNFPKQRKHKYFTSQKVLSQKKQESFFREKHFTSQEVFHIKIHDCKTIITEYT